MSEETRLSQVILDSARQEGGFFHLPSSVRLRVTGTDALRYLNGQVSNDLRKLADGDSMTACVLSAKGKLEAVIVVWKDAGGFVIEGPGELDDGLQMRIEKYVVADDVVVEPESVEDEWHVFGEGALAKAEALESLRRVSRLGVAGADFSADAVELIRGVGIREFSVVEIEAVRIDFGVPAWGRELGEDTLPAEVGLDRTAVDFHKGCYIGQETVSRIQSVGRVNRQLFRFRTDSCGRFLSGLGIFNDGDAADAKPVGLVTSHVNLDNQSIGLCFARHSTDVLAPLVVRDHTQEFVLTISRL